MIARFEPMHQRGISLTFGGLVRIIADLVTRYTCPDRIAGYSAVW